MENQKKKNNIIYIIERILSPIFFAVSIAAIYVGIFLFTLDFFYRDKFFPHTYILGTDISEMSKLEVKNFLQEKIKTYNTEGITFLSSGVEKKYSPASIGIDINVSKTISQAYKFGREPLTLNGIADKLSLMGKHKVFKIYYSINQESLKNFIDNEFIVNDNPINSSLQLSGDNYLYVEGKNGYGLNKKYLTAKISDSINNLSLETILVPHDLISSTITKQEINKAKEESKKLLNKTLTLKFEDEDWEITADDLKNWIDFVPQKAQALTTSNYLLPDNYDLDKFLLASFGLNKFNGSNYNQVLAASLNRSQVGKYLQKLALQIEIPAQNARLQMTDGKLYVLKPSEKGRELLIDKNFQSIVNAIYAGEIEYTLETRETGAEITANNIDDLGIKEIIAIGESDFSNSPANRRHNIAVAAEKLNGILIKPNEEYSLVDNIGEVNAESGYLPELVIKENKTIPEYGGGLCQIATTNFRAAVNAGFEVTERQNHSYAVSYYNPQGTDATIYIPRPDLRFINDTPGYVLLQTKIEGNKLIFEFYGAKDGRQVELQGPYYWDRKSDGSFKARWVQIVKNNNEIIREQEFKSFYDNPAKYHH